MHTVYLALGANVGDCEKNIEQAVSLLAEKIKIVLRAKNYKSTAVGYKDQNDFVNTALVGETELEPKALLAFIKDIEEKVGRKERFRWGPREIDVDILMYDDLVYRDETLEIPHRAMAERDFVLIPLAEIAPELLHPLLHKKVRELLAEIPHERRSVQD